MELSLDALMRMGKIINQMIVVNKCVGAACCINIYSC
jgi:hypothetical protein